MSSYHLPSLSNNRRNSGKFSRGENTASFDDVGRVKTEQDELRRVLKNEYMFMVLKITTFVYIFTIMSLITISACRTNLSTQQRVLYSNTFEYESILIQL